LIINEPKYEIGYYPMDLLGGYEISVKYYGLLADNPFTTDTSDPVFTSSTSQPISFAVLLPIEEADQACSKDEDCARIAVDCTDCGCGAAVHQRHAQKYLQQIKAVCASYEEPACQPLCPTPVLQCLNSRCAFTEP